MNAHQHESTMFEALEERTLLAADLAATAGDLSPAAWLLPGERLTVQYSIANAGPDSAIGTTSTRFALSADTNWSTGDRVLGEVPVTLRLSAGDSTSQRIRLDVPQDMEAGTFYLLGLVDAAAHFNETNEANNVAVLGTVTVCWRFGNFDERANVTLTLTDSAGTPVTFQLRGGSGHVSPGVTGWDITVVGTDPRSTLSIRTRGSGTEAVLGNVSVDGSLKTFSGRTSTLAGTMTINGSVASIDLAKISAGRIDIDEQASPGVAAKIDLGLIENGGISTTGGIASLTAWAWTDGGNSLLRANYVDKLSLTGSRSKAWWVAPILEADLDLGGSAHGRAYTLGRLDCQSVRFADWNINGNVGAVSVDRAYDLTVNVLGDIASWQAAETEQTSLTASGKIHSLRTGAASGIDLQAATLGSLIVSGDWQGDLELTGAGASSSLGSAQIGGALWSGTWSIADGCGPVSVGGTTHSWVFTTPEAASVQVARIISADIDVHRIRSLTAEEWQEGSFTATIADSVRITGNSRTGVAGVFGADMCMHLGESDECLGIFYVNGAVKGNAVLIKSARQIDIGCLQNSSMLIGCMAISGSVNDFYCENGVGQLTIRGVESNGSTIWLDHSQLGAWTIGSLVFGARPTTLGGTMEYHQIDSVTNEPGMFAPLELVLLKV